jgi:DNA-binding LacI/PurR family transcriptional regulator
LRGYDDKGRCEVAATMADVAQLANVSIKSVSNYLNDYPYMSASLRQRIGQAIEQLDYRVNVSARNLRSGRTGNIALVVPELNQAYFAELANDVIREAQSFGLNVFVETTDGQLDHELAILAGERRLYVDGVIFAPLGLGPRELARIEVHFPLVFAGDCLLDGGVDVVTMANTDGARTAVTHLLGRGRRRVLAVGVEPISEASAPALRLAGYVAAHRDAGVDVDETLFVRPNAWHRPAGASVVDEALARGLTFDAVFGFNDALAIGAITALTRAGRRVPDDVAVVGFDDTEDASFAIPALTTIDPGRDTIARDAVTMLIDRMGNGSSVEPRRIVAPYCLVPRASS